MCYGRERFQQHRDASCHLVFFFLQGKAPEEMDVIRTETLACFLPGWAQDLSTPLYMLLRKIRVRNKIHLFNVSEKNLLKFASRSCQIIET